MKYSVNVPYLPILLYDASFTEKGMCLKFLSLFLMCRAYGLLNMYILDSSTSQEKKIKQVKVGGFQFN